MYSAPCSLFNKAWGLFVWLKYKLSISPMSTFTHVVPNNLEFTWMGGSTFHGLSKHGPPKPYFETLAKYHW